MSSPKGEETGIALFRHYNRMGNRSSSSLPSPTQDGDVVAIAGRASSLRRLTFGGERSHNIMTEQKRALEGAVARPLSQIFDWLLGREIDDERWPLGHAAWLETGGVRTTIVRRSRGRVPMSKDIGSHRACPKGTSKAEGAGVTARSGWRLRCTANQR